MCFEIRLETESDHREVENLTREAFWNLHVPGCDEHLLVHNLRKCPAFIKDLDFVAVKDGRVVGNIMYATGYVEDAFGARHKTLLFGPLSVLPQYQGQGIGYALVRHSLNTARGMGYGAVIIYGSPAYYHRFGFGPAKAFGIMRPDGKYFAPLMAMELYQGALHGISGRFYEDPVYTLDPALVEAFDRQFPYKEKKTTQSQLDFAALRHLAEEP